MKIAVYDLVGGYYLISQSLENLVRRIRSKINNGDRNLGGDDFDQKIMNWLAEEIQVLKSKLTLRQDPLALQRLKEASEKKLKLKLSSSLRLLKSTLHTSLLPRLVLKHLVRTLTAERI